MSSSCPPELEGNLPEPLLKTLTRPDFEINAVVDEYLRVLDNGQTGAAGEAWRDAPRHAYVITNLLLVESHLKIAVEQLLKDRIRQRIRAVHG